MLQAWWSFSRCLAYWEESLPQMKLSLKVLLLQRSVNQNENPFSWCLSWEAFVEALGWGHYQIKGLHKTIAKCGADFGNALVRWSYWSKEIGWQMRSNSVNKSVAEINLYGWLYEIALGTLQSIKDPPWNKIYPPYCGSKLHLPLFYSTKIECFTSNNSPITK